jgi:hypothetical protein
LKSIQENIYPELAKVMGKVPIRAFVDESGSVTRRDIKGIGGGWWGGLDAS